MFYRRIFTASVLVVAMVSMFVFGYVIGMHPSNSAVQAQDSPGDDTEELFEPFWEAWGLLHENYVDPLDDNTLMEGALTGMMASLGDPHTDYMNPETFARVNEAMSGAYEGIGAAVRLDEETGGLELVSVMPGSPAEKAGLRPGDEIIAVGGESVIGWDQNEIIAQVRGPAGTPVLLGIQRPGEDESFEVEVTRERISVSSVSYEVLDGDIAYVRISQFEFETNATLRAALEEMDANNRKGLILDLRGDPGGYLTTAIEVGSAFIAEGPIVLERGPNREHTYQAMGNAIAPDVPMVVLVDQGSASASELIAGALQDQNRATVIGLPTFGKGSVQTWHTLSNGGGIRITISRWYTPNGRSVSEVGIEPDILISYPLKPVFDDAGERVDPQLEAAIQVLEGVEVPSETVSDLPGLDDIEVTAEPEQSMPESTGEPTP